MFARPSKNLGSNLGQFLGNVIKAYLLKKVAVFTRLRLAGHAYRDKASPVHHLVTWIPKHGATWRGGPHNHMSTP